MAWADITTTVKENDSKIVKVTSVNVDWGGTPLTAGYDDLQNEQVLCVRKEAPEVTVECLDAQTFETIRNAAKQNMTFVETGCADTTKTNYIHVKQGVVITSSHSATWGEPATNSLTLRADDAKLTDTVADPWLTP